ncbi:hypothetical protein EVB41_033 [Rhizobium phage RHph_TM3_14A]|nr:hypothetical protein EVB29_033 [Rhizobium phage RHph_TM27A]QIG66953.1 hypothetical protein EVB30_033 [Rhizobium phage RHph_TM27B]QIG67498.1 hypothetical protein EVB41_033 [Rhizobium phage RHph_TM3_14A]
MTHEEFMQHQCKLAKHYGGHVTAVVVINKDKSQSSKIVMVTGPYDREKMDATNAYYLSRPHPLNFAYRVNIKLKPLPKYEGMK